MNIYHNERLLCKIDNNMSDLMKVIDDDLAKRGIKNDGYMRFVELDNDLTMIDYGSWSDFFYIDCTYTSLIKDNDKKRDLPTDKK